MKLSDEELLTTPSRGKTYKLFDGNGLYAEVPPSGNIRWRVKYIFQGKEKRLSLGIYPEVSIDEARLRTSEVKGQLKDGIDPSEARKLLKIEFTKTQVKKPKARRVAPPSLIDLIIETREGIRNLLREMQYDRLR